jgi:hypothetical protein
MSGGFTLSAGDKSSIGSGSASPADSALGGGFKVASQLKSGSVMDILGGGSKSTQSSPLSSSSLQPAASLKQGSVMDILGDKGKIFIQILC